MTTRRTSEIACDGCGKRLEWWCRTGRPEGWRLLRVYDGGGRCTVLDVCGPMCGARAIDTTYDEPPVQLQSRRHLVPVEG